MKRLIFAFLLLLTACASQNQDMLSITLDQHRNLAMHIHPSLEIRILGEQQAILAGTGISNAGMRVIHTHDSTGKLHVEAPRPHQFYLQDFFTIWGETFNSTCIMDHCVDENHALSFFVNGVPSNLYENAALKDGDRIRIVYAQK